jgi:hypothetical protein
MIDEQEKHREDSAADIAVFRIRLLTMNDALS